MSRPIRLLHANHAFDAGTRVIRTADPGATLELRLQLCEHPGLAAYLRAQAAYADHRFLSLGELRARFGVSANEHSRIRKYLHDRGLEFVSEDGAGRTICARGTVAAIERALGIRLWIHSSTAGEFIASDSAPRLPAELAGFVAAVHGIDHRPICPPRRRVLGAPRTVPARSAAAESPRAGTAAPDATSKVVAPPYSPLDVAALYDYPASTGAGTRVAIVEFGGGFDPELLRRYFHAVLGNDGPRLNVVSIAGATNDPTSSDAVEVMLDLEVLGALVPDASFDVYFAPNTASGWPEALRQAILADPTPDVISISWGAVEDVWPPSVCETMDQYLRLAAARGVTICCSTGDYGVQPTSFGTVRVEFPASNPNVLACGGTQLDPQVARPDLREVGWRDRTRASGGGISVVYPVPGWQRSANTQLNLTTEQGGRGIPDVSGNAAPATGYDILLNDGSWRTIGGTSAVAPLWAGLLLRCVALLGRRLGAVNPLLYAAKAAGVFDDVVLGTNAYGSVPGYVAGTGWDAVTGLGTPRGQGLLSYLRGA